MKAHISKIKEKKQRCRSQNVTSVTRYLKGPLILSNSGGNMQSLDQGLDCDQSYKQKTGWVKFHMILKSKNKKKVSQKMRWNKKSYCGKFVFAETLVWCKTVLPKPGKAITGGEQLTILSFHWWLHSQSELLGKTDWVVSLAKMIHAYSGNVDLWVMSIKLLSEPQEWLFRGKGQEKGTKPRIW